jgi:hypothetical protein
MTNANEIDEADEALQERVVDLVETAYALKRGGCRETRLPSALEMHWDDLEEEHKDLLLFVGLHVARSLRDDA